MTRFRCPQYQYAAPVQQVAYPAAPRAIAIGSAGPQVQYAAPVQQVTVPQPVTYAAAPQFMSPAPEQAVSRGATTPGAITPVTFILPHNEREHSCRVMDHDDFLPWMQWPTSSRFLLLH
jgi:hypothetical protein